jgi:hypothetical protein
MLEDIDRHKYGKKKGRRKGIANIYKVFPCQLLIVVLAEWSYCFCSATVIISYLCLSEGSITFWLPK